MGSRKTSFRKKIQQEQNVGADGRTGAKWAQGANGAQPQLDLGADGRMGANGARAQSGRMGAKWAHQNNDETLSSEEEFLPQGAGPVTEFRSAMASPRPKSPSARVLRSALKNSPKVQ